MSGGVDIPLDSMADLNKVVRNTVLEWASIVLLVAALIVGGALIAVLAAADFAAGVSADAELAGLVYGLQFHETICTLFSELSDRESIGLMQTEVERLVDTLRVER